MKSQISKGRKSFKKWITVGSIAASSLLPIQDVHAPGVNHVLQDIEPIPIAQVDSFFQKNTIGVNQEDEEIISVASQSVVSNGVSLQETSSFNESAATHLGQKQIKKNASKKTLLNEILPTEEIPPEKETIKDDRAFIVVENEDTIYVNVSDLAPVIVSSDAVAVPNILGDTNHPCGAGCIAHVSQPTTNGPYTVATSEFWVGGYNLSGASADSNTIKANYTAKIGGLVSLYKEDKLNRFIASALEISPNFTILQNWIEKQSHKLAHKINKKIPPEDNNDFALLGITTPVETCSHDGHANKIHLGVNPFTIQYTGATNFKNINFSKVLWVPTASASYTRDFKKSQLGLGMQLSPNVSLFLEDSGMEGLDEMTNMFSDHAHAPLSVTGFYGLNTLRFGTKEPVKIVFTARYNLDQNPSFVGVIVSQDNWFVNGRYVLDSQNKTSYPFVKLGFKL